MKLPVLTLPTTRAIGTGGHLASSAIVPQGCGLGKKIACAASVLACATACATGIGAPACAACFAAIGAGSCIDCA